MEKLSRMGLVAALYVVLTVMPPFYALSYGPIQIRVSECLTVLPFLFPETIWGLTAGCLIANTLGNVGFHDIVFGRRKIFGGVIVSTSFLHSLYSRINIRFSVCYCLFEISLSFSFLLSKFNCT
ncbi:MAG: QueT transporter family protein [Atribacterota bacterium]